MKLGFDLPPGVPSCGPGQELFELEQPFGATGIPASALAFEAAVDLDFDVFLHGARAGLDLGRGASAAALQLGGDLPPSVNALPVAQEVAEQGLKLLGPLVAQRAGAEGGQRRLAVGVPDRLHEAAELGLIRPGEGAHGLGDVLAIQQPGGERKVVLAQPFQAFVAVAEQGVNGGAEVAVGQPLEGRAEQGQRGGGD